MAEKSLGKSNNKEVYDDLLYALDVLKIRFKLKISQNNDRAILKITSSI